jgi:hypothetical protein
MIKNEKPIKTLSHFMGEGRSRRRRDQVEGRTGQSPIRSEHHSRDLSKSVMVSLALILALFLTLPSPTHSDLPPAPSTTFSIAIIPDTQHYRGKDTKSEPDSQAPITNAVFDAYTNWVSANLDAQRIVFVSHVGDIVDKNVPEQWAVARNAMNRLHGKIPYGISVGNHDMTSDGNSSLFQEYFPASRFSDLPWYGGSYTSDDTQDISGNNANSYQLFSASGVDFVFLHLECNAPDDVLAWSTAILDQHKNRVAFVTTHMGLGPLNKPTEGDGFYDDPKGLMQWTKRHKERGNTPQQMWDKCFRKHSNLRAVFCGDQSRTQSMYAAKQGDTGNLVHYFLSDYGSNGLRVYRFTPDRDRLNVITYNPIQAALCDSTRIVPDPGRHQFSVQFDLP